jgi:hypothetical protein
MPRTRPFAVVSFAPIRNQLAAIEGSTSLMKSSSRPAEWRNLMTGMVESRDRPLNIMNILGGYVLPHDRLTSGS